MDRGRKTVIQRTQISDWWLKTTTAVEFSHKQDGASRLER
jgi:hypothetical protein